MVLRGTIAFEMIQMGLTGNFRKLGGRGVSTKILYGLKGFQNIYNKRGDGWPVQQGKILKEGSGVQTKLGEKNM